MQSSEYRSQELENDTFLPPAASEYHKDELANSLDILAQVVHILDIHDTSYQSYSTALTNLLTRDMALSRSLDRLSLIESELTSNLALLEHESQLIAHWNQVLTPGSCSSLYAEDAATVERRKDAIVKKAKEYHQELEALLSNGPIGIQVTASQLLAQKECNQIKQRELKEKRAKLKTFQGLPPNLDLARHELNNARKEQMNLVKLRERLLARMADSVT